MSHIDGGYDPQGSYDMATNGSIYQRNQEAGRELKSGEASFLNQQNYTGGDRRGSNMTMNYLYPNAMNGTDSNFLLSGYNAMCQFQNGDENGNAGDAMSMAMPRVVDWSDACGRNQGSSLLGKIGPEDSSQVTASSSGYISTKNYANHTLDSSFDSSQNFKGEFDMSGEMVNSLTLKLKIKETQNESLENEIQKLRSSFNEALNFKQSGYKYERQNKHAEKAPLEVSKTPEHIFRRLSTTLRSKDDELAETKTALESILTALALDPTNSVTKYGRYDAEALAHKMVSRIETLTKENQEMAKMLAYGRAKEMQIQLQLAQMKNKELSKTISELQRPDDVQ